MLLPTQACTYSKDGVGVTYDLSKLKQEGPYYLEGGDLECTWDTVEQNYTYFFAFCGSVGKSPAPACKGKDGAVLQMDYEGPTSCKSAGKPVTDKSAYGWADPNDPAAGFRVTYTGGEMCHTNKVARQTTVVAYCDEAGTAKDGANQVREVGGPKSCQYEIIYHSSYACPQECPVTGDDRKACGGNGHCRFDTDANAARCFCSNGWGGVDCTTDLNAGMSGTIIGLLVTVFIFTIGLGAALALLYRQVRNYRSDANNYLKLRGQELVKNDSI